MVGKAERLTWHKAWTMVSTGFSISYTSRQEAMLREVMPSARTECPVIRVMKDSFQLSALPRHCGDDMTLNTPSIPLSELKTNVTAFITPPTYI